MPIEFVVRGSALAVVPGCSPRAATGNDPHKSAKSAGAQVDAMRARRRTQYVCPHDHVARSMHGDVALVMSSLAWQLLACEFFTLRNSESAPPAS